MSAKNSKRQQEASAPHVCYQVNGRYRSIAVTSKHVQHARDCKKVNVMPGRACKRPALSPSSYSTVYEFRITLHARFGTKPKTLHYARPKSLDENVSTDAK